ncbi:hypothetical protein DFH27DRAFT_609835 [Peziza echinospora]|nr:hypothetical protein DFH27DRAFT_609835 [Peziza echinospora]
MPRLHIPAKGYESPAPHQQRITPTGLPPPPIILHEARVEMKLSPRKTVPGALRTPMKPAPSTPSMRSRPLLPTEISPQKIKTINTPTTLVKKPTGTAMAKTPNNFPKPPKSIRMTASQSSLIKAKVGTYITYPQQSPPAGCVKNQTYPKRSPSAVNCSESPSKSSFAIGTSSRTAITGTQDTPSDNFETLPSISRPLIPSPVLTKMDTTITVSVKNGRYVFPEGLGKDELQWFVDRQLRRIEEALEEVENRKQMLKIAYERMDALSNSVAE